MEPNVPSEDLSAYQADAKECESRGSTEVRYVLTQKGGQALLYCGYCFYKVRDGENRKTFWRCSKYRTESCEVRVTTQEDRVVSIRGEHNHPPEHDPDRRHGSSESQLNWIRNRRRPNAAKSAEKIAEKIAAYASTASLSSTQVPPTLIPSTLTPLTTLPHTVVVTATNPHHTAPGLIRVGDGAPSAQAIQYNSIPHIGVPEPKRLCLDHNSQNSHPHPTQPSPSPSSTSQPLLVVKVRLCGSGECDFVEVEVPTVTYQALLQTCCEELEVNATDVAKIRKLPNVLIRKDRDIQRMKEGQELEIVLKSEAISPPSSYMTSMLTVNPFSSNAVLAIQNHVQPRSEAIMPMTLTQGKAEENGTGNLISGLNDSSSQLSDVHSHSHSTATVNGLQ